MAEGSVGLYTKAGDEEDESDPVWLKDKAWLDDRVEYAIQNMNVSGLLIHFGA